MWTDEYNDKNKDKLLTPLVSVSFISGKLLKL